MSWAGKFGDLLQVDAPDELTIGLRNQRQPFSAGDPAQKKIFECLAEILLDLAAVSSVQLDMFNAKTCELRHVDRSSKSKLKPRERAVIGNGARRNNWGFGHINHNFNRLFG